MEFGLYLRNLRRLKGYTIRELAKQASISHSYVSQVENGSRNPTPSLLKKLQPHLDVSMKELMIKAGYDIPDKLTKESSLNISFISLVAPDIDESLNKEIEQVLKLYINLSQQERETVFGYSDYLVEGD